MVFTQPPHAIRLFYIIASPAQLWRAGTRAFKFEARLGVTKCLTRGLGVCRRDVFECPPGTWLSALARALGNLMGSHGGTWAIGPSAGTAPAARPPLVGLLCGAVPAGRQFIAASPKAWFSSPLAGVWTSIAQGRGHGAGCGAEVRDGRQHHRRWSNTKLGSSVTGETVAARTRHHSHPCSARGARRRSPTTTVPLGTSTTAPVRTLSIVLVNLGSTKA